jgi:hypothetical protein
MKLTIVILLVALAVYAVMMRDQLAEWLRRSRSSNWPLTAATIEGGEIAIFKAKNRNIFTVTLSYSYHVDGEYYSGYHIQEFYSESDAESYIETHKRRVTDICYDPQKPEVSVLRLEQLLR